MAEKAFLKFDEHPKFPTTNDMAIMNSRDICKYINGVFSRVFADYLGSNVIVDQMDPQAVGFQMNPIRVELYFQLGQLDPSSDKKIVAFKPIGEKKTDSVDSSVRRNNYIQQTVAHNYVMTHNKSSEITQDAIDILVPMLNANVARILSKDPKPAELEARGIIVEGCDVDQYATALGNPKQTIYNIVHFLDIDSLFSIIFTDKEKDEKMFYVTTPVKPMIPMINNYNPTAAVNAAGQQKWLFQVSRLNYQNIMSKCNELGVFQSTNGLPIYTETY